MSGLRLVSNKFIPLTSWDHDFVVVNSRLVDDIPLPCLAAFDLLNPLDNSGHGWKATKGGGVIRNYGLDFTRTGGGGSTDFIASKDAVSVLCAVKPNTYDAFSTFLDCRNVTAGSGSGFCIDFSPNDRAVRVQVVYPSGTGVSYRSPTFVENEWNILCITLSSASLRIENQHGDVVPNEFTSPINITRWAIPMLMGQGVSGGTCDGSVGFFSVYDGYMTPAQRKSAIAVGKEIMASRA
ncbi:hypothetical protein [Erwinia sp. S38]|uniref:hypothetical protein n=1 Tax=Erwinia sp. S38 TaxID=2769338 RepID=UPI00190A1D97|nr:hypothetical protein [Erwinia sp. S38]MBK0000278.1 hypothetical protein [Erwinia sp. S38]